MKDVREELRDAVDTLTSAVDILSEKLEKNADVDILKLQGLIKERDEWEILLLNSAAHLAILDQLDRIEEKVERLEKNANM